MENGRLFLSAGYLKRHRASHLGRYRTPAVSETGAPREGATRVAYQLRWRYDLSKVGSERCSLAGFARARPSPISSRRARWQGTNGDAYASLPVLGTTTRLQAA